MWLFKNLVNVLLHSLWFSPQYHSNRMVTTTRAMTAITKMMVKKMEGVQLGNTTCTFKRTAVYTAISSKSVMLKSDSLQPICTAQLLFHMAPHSSTADATVRAMKLLSVIHASFPTRTPSVLPQSLLYTFQQITVFPERSWNMFPNSHVLR